LAELIDLAEAHNPETRVAWEGARAQLAALGIARSELYATLAAIALSQTNRAKAEYNATRFNQAFSSFQQAAEAKNSEAMEYLGYMYEEGYGVTQDYGQERQWYEKAEAAGSVDAKISLGSLYYYGNGVTQDYVQARQWTVSV